VVNLARHLDLDSEMALKRANAKFERRFRRMEALAEEAGQPLAQSDLAAQETLWGAVKREEGRGKA
jgi:ATP diphosphatase